MNDLVLLLCFGFLGVSIAMLKEAFKRKDLKVIIVFSTINITLWWLYAIFF